MIKRIVILTLMLALLTGCSGSEHFRWHNSSQRKEEGYVGYLQWCEKKLMGDTTDGYTMWMHEEPTRDYYDELEAETFNLVPPSQCSSFDNVLN